MRIVQVIPGSGDNFYCENCVRDGATVRALAAAGHDVLPVPLYLPQVIDPVEAISSSPVFYGGINSYLQQKSGFFRWTPRWIDRLFDSRALLRMAAKRAGSVRASGLGELTLSVLKGEEGRQVKELERLLRWLGKQPKPDVVHLSSPLLLGIGTAIKKRLGVPLVCTMQDEDVWIDAMEEPARTQCWEAMASGAREVDAFIAVSRYFGDVMRGRLKIEASKLHAVPIGIDPGPAPSAKPPETPTIGYLARMSRGMGLGILVDAYFELRKTVPNLRLHLSGGKTGDDVEFLEGLRGRFASGDVTIVDEFDEAKRREFLSGLTLLSVPTPNGAAFGTYILEALACGVPVVQPRVGSFPELVEATGGGGLYEPNDAATLARALGDLLADPGRRAELGRRGRESVVQRYSLATMATTLIDVYRRVLSPTC